MAKKKKTQPTRNADSVDSKQVQTESVKSDPGNVESWSPQLKTILSLVVVVHLFAVFAAPWAIPQPSSELARATNQLFSPWTHMLYMRHGYRFFAPDPGPSHLILYEVTKDNGEIVEGRFPDRNLHTPRLLYHRFFMISEHFWGLGISQTLTNQEQVNELVRAAEQLRSQGMLQQADWIMQNLPQSNPEPPTDEEIDGIVADLKQQGKHFAARSTAQALRNERAGNELADRHREVWLAGIANYLKQKHDGQTVRIWIQEHRIANYNHILDGGKLTDVQNYGPRQLVFSEDEVIQ